MQIIAPREIFLGVCIFYDCVPKKEHGLLSDENQYKNQDGRNSVRKKGM